MSSIHTAPHAPIRKTFDQQFAEVFNEAKPTTPAVVGVVTYDVLLQCPHCNRLLMLNKYPYNDDNTEFCPAEDYLGLALFGTTDKPAQWDGISVKYTCFACHGDFTVASLEL